MTRVIWRNFRTRLHDLRLQRLLLYSTCCFIVPQLVGGSHTCCPVAKCSYGARPIEVPRPEEPRIFWNCFICPRNCKRAARTPGFVKKIRKQTIPERLMVDTECVTSLAARVTTLFKCHDVRLGSRCLKLVFLRPAGYMLAYLPSSLIQPLGRRCCKVAQATQNVQEGDNGYTQCSDQTLYD